MAFDNYARLLVMKIIILVISLSLLSLFGLTACQSVPPTEAAADIDSDVCIGDPMVVDDPDKLIDLEEMAKQADCP